MTIFSQKSGFTLIEFAIALVFIGFLSITITVLIKNVTAVFNRGVTIKNVNSVGQNIIDDFTVTIQGAPAKELSSICYTAYGEDKITERESCISDAATKFTTQVRTGSVRFIGNGVETGDIPIGGVFCTGSYSYIWNSGYLFDNAQYEVTGGNAITLTSGPPTDTTKYENFRLLKVRDTSREICASSITGSGRYNSSMQYNLEISNIVGQPEDLLANVNNSLALYNLSVATPIQDKRTKNVFYSFSFILGTIRGGANITTTSDYCPTHIPEDYNVEDFDYCAINKFNFAAQAAGE